MTVDQETTIPTAGTLQDQFIPVPLHSEAPILGEGTGNDGQDQIDQSKKGDPLYLDENLLPASIIMRIAKGALGDGAAIGKEAKEALIRSCTVFANYLTATALAHADKKSKTIGIEHVYRALAVLELDSSILSPVKEAVAAHSAIQKEKRDSYRKKVKEQKDKGGPGDILDPASLGEDMEVDDEERHVAAIPQKRPGDELERETELDNVMETAE